jgi:hypothetical protein
MKVKIVQVDTEASRDEAFAEPVMFVDYDVSNRGRGKHLGYWTTSLVNDPYDLPWPGDFIDSSWDPVEREAVASYLDAQPDVQHWMGYSFCRLGCGTIPKCTDKSDGIYVWPGGFSHYLRVHNVRPPQEFIDHALGRVVQTEVFFPELLSLPSVYPLPDWVTQGAQVRVILGDGVLSVGIAAKVHSFVDDRVNIELDDGSYYNYLRGDFAGIFAPVWAHQVSPNTAQGLGDDVLGSPTRAT